MNKIEALQKTIYNLENDVYVYNWYSYNSCNCGVLAKTLLGGREPETCGLQSSPSIGHGGSFSKFAHCLTTNLPLPLVFQSLKDAGFTHKELIDLEFLSNESILTRLGIQPDVDEDDNTPYYPDAKFDKKQNLIPYLKAWVQILQEEQQKVNSEQEAQVSDTTKADQGTEAGEQYPDIRKSLAILPENKLEVDVKVKEVV